MPGASGYEWNAVTKELATEHTVYTIDLLGCGRSEKPEITYTNFVFAQLLCDFAKNVIKEETDVIASGFPGLLHLWHIAITLIIFARSC